MSITSACRPLKYTLCITLKCNLACTYCYVAKAPVSMDMATARKAIDFAFSFMPRGGDLEMGFFGGEPFLEFDLLRRITRLVENHPSFDPEHVSLAVTTNGTIFSDEIASFLTDHSFKVCISCDGPPEIQNSSRRIAEGKETALIVERTLTAACAALPEVMVNAVFNPGNFRNMRQTVEYLSGTGARQIFLNPDYSATWTPADVDELRGVYRSLAGRYVEWYLSGVPHFVSLIDSKVAVLLRGGYQPMERCHMGTAELAVTPDGSIYPCERLIGGGPEAPYRIGHIDTGIDPSSRSRLCACGGSSNPECVTCSVREYCMNWCGCSNIFMTGLPDRVGDP
jgi:uncharacterized protein